LYEFLLPCTTTLSELIEWCVHANFILLKDVRGEITDDFGVDR
jgi:hypothetical protein